MITDLVSYRHADKKDTRDAPSTKTDKSNMDTAISPPETLPADAVIFANKRSRSKYAKNVTSHIGWWRGPDGKSDTVIAYYWPKGGLHWKLLKPNNDPNKGRRHDIFSHRGIALVTPSSPREAGITTLLVATVAHESDKNKSTQPPDEEISGSPKFPHGNGD